MENSRDNAIGLRTTSAASTNEQVVWQYKVELGISVGLSRATSSKHETSHDLYLRVSYIHRLSSMNVPFNETFGQCVVAIEIGFLCMGLIVTVFSAYAYHRANTVRMASAKRDGINESKYTVGFYVI